VHGENPIKTPWTPCLRGDSSAPTPKRVTISAFSVTFKFEEVVKKIHGYLESEFAAGLSDFVIDRPNKL
jgi:hypothetical protein